MTLPPLRRRSVLAGYQVFNTWNRYTKSINLLVNQLHFPWRWCDVQTLSLQKYVVSAVVHVFPLLFAAWLNPTRLYKLGTKSTETLARVEHLLTKTKNKRHTVFVLLRKASRARFPRENSFSRCSSIEGKTR